MRIRTKLVLNTISLVAIDLLLIASSLFGLARLKEKVSDLTQRSTPFQTRTLDLQRSLQHAVAALTRASASHTLPELEASEAEVRIALEDVRSTEAALAAIAPSEAHTSQELSALSSELFTSIRDMLTATEAAEETSRRSALQLAECVRQLKNLDSRIRASPRPDRDELLLATSESLWLTATIDARSRSPVDTAKVREAFQQDWSTLANLEKLLRKQEATGELPTLAAIQASTYAAQQLILSSPANLPSPDKLAEVNQRLAALVARNAQQSRAQVSGAFADQEKTAHSVTDIVQGTKTRILSLGAGAILICAFFSVVLSVGISRPLREFTAVALRLASGDFSAQANPQRKDEFSGLAQHWNHAAASIASLLTQVAHACNGLAQNASKFSLAAASVTQETGAIATSIETNLSNTTQTTAKIKMTSEVVTSSNASMIELCSTAKSMAETSQAAGKLIHTINEIAFKTSLLSLNAAVEAARAGTAGAGFEIVASEVRNLANQSSQAAQTTSALIGEIASKTHRGAELAESARLAFEKVNSLTSDVEILIQAIDTSSRQQASQIRKIDAHASGIVQLASSNISAAKQLSTSLARHSGGKPKAKAWKEASKYGLPRARTKV